MFTIGTIIQNKTNGMRAVIGVGGEARWLGTGEPIFNKIDPDEWLECEVSVPREPSTLTITIHDGGGTIVSRREVEDSIMVRVNSNAGTPNRTAFDRGGCFS